MTYRETLAYLYSLARFGMKPGTGRIALLLERLGNPQERLTAVHVAGTNGKGSTAAFLATIATVAGNRTGLFTSPHLIRFTERIRIDGHEISEDGVVQLAQRVIAVAPPDTTFFEYVTAMALLHFAEQGVELAILEAGMGGRFDATAVVRGAMTVITPIGLDHCAWLGDTLTDIAREKAGLIRAGRPTVVADQEDETLAVIRAECQRLGSPGYLLGCDFDAAWEETGLSYRGLGLTLTGLSPGIGGRFQRVNAACALAAAELLARAGLSITPSALCSGITAASWPGRMELVPGTPRLLIDGAHNPAGALALAESLTDYPRRRLFLVIGVMEDKDVNGLLAPLTPLASEALTVTPGLERAMPAGALARLLRDRGVPSRAAGSVAHGLTVARERAGADDLILVCGSLFTAGEALAAIRGEPAEQVRG